MANLLKLMLLIYFPAIAKKFFDAKREREDQLYWSSFKMSPCTRHLEMSPQNQTKLLFILPPGYRDSSPFEPAQGNYNYEIVRSAIERYGENSVEVFHSTTNNDWAYECRKIVEFVGKNKITHLMFYIASKEARTHLWRWDILAGELRRHHTDVTAIGYLTDGTYELHQVRCRRFQDVYPKSIFIQIDAAPSDKYVKHGRLIGPTFLPISHESMGLIQEHLSHLQNVHEYDLSFVGKMYGYRKKIIEKLISDGLKIAINPQKSEEIGGKASYLDYLSALSRSTYTLNLARANGRRQKQLKSRILESVIVGSIPVTDDDGLTQNIFSRELPFIGFKRPGEILDIVSRNPRDWASSSRTLLGPSPAREEIVMLACGHFWETLEKGLKNTALPCLIPKSLAS